MVPYRRFYKCDDGTAFRNFCPTGLYWDDERKFCTYKEEAKCGPLEPKKKEEEVDDAAKVLLDLVFNELQFFVLLY